MNTRIYNIKLYMYIDTVIDTCLEISIYVNISYIMFRIVHVPALILSSVSFISYRSDRSYHIVPWVRRSPPSSYMSGAGRWRLQAAPPEVFVGGFIRRSLESFRRIRRHVNKRINAWTIGSGGNIDREHIIFKKDVYSSYRKIHIWSQ